jgi:molybdate transport system substrate-binding protein
MPTRTVPLLLARLLTAGCGLGAGDDDTVLTVFAAASLAEPFEDVAERFEAEHEGVRVELALAGSADLVTQVRGGAPADVLATADEATMAKVVADDLATEPRVFATNTLTIAVAAGNPQGVEGLEDLAGLDVVVCAPAVPCGAATRRLERAAGVDLQPVSEEQSVTDVLNKVVSGEADAGLVYVTDVRRASRETDSVPVPEASEAVNRYPIAVLEDSQHPELAQEFVDLVLGDRAVFPDEGFGPP